MNYESSILKRLIEVYGVVGNPRYISEIIKQFIVQGKECYPNLFTYQADWLAHIDEFGLTPEYTVSYTGQHIYAPNTKEKPVKSAILKGNTGYRDIDTGEILETFEEGRNLELVSVKMPVLTTIGKNLFNVNKAIDGYLDSAGGVITSVDAYNKLSDYIEIKPNTTYVYSHGGFTIPEDSKLKTLWTRYYTYDENKTKLTYETKTTESFSLTTPTNAKYIRIGSRFIGLEGAYAQIEEGSTATSYEPYKTNILTVNEEVELRGIDDIQDELDLLTGELTERIGEIVLDGSTDEVWSHNPANSGENTAVFYLANRFNNHITSVIMDKFIPYIGTNFWTQITNDNENHLTNNADLAIRISKSKLSSIDISGFRQWLSQNPVIVQYHLANESIKTVDLTIKDQNDVEVSQLSSFNGGTHFSTSSQEGSLLPSLIVDVVTNLEETLKVCSLEGNTM